MIPSQLLEKLKVALRNLAEGDNGYERPTRDFAQRQYHECCRLLDELEAALRASMDEDSVLVEADCGCVFRVQRGVSIKPVCVSVGCTQHAGESTDSGRASTVPPDEVRAMQRDAAALDARLRQTERITAEDLNATVTRQDERASSVSPSIGTEQGWQPIDTAPEAPGMVSASMIVAAESGAKDGTLVVGEAERDEDGQFWWANERNDYHASTITHRVRFWRPLPDPPACPSACGSATDPSSASLASAIPTETDPSK